MSCRSRCGLRSSLRCKFGERGRSAAHGLPVELRAQIGRVRGSFCGCVRGASIRTAAAPCAVGAGCGYGGGVAVDPAGDAMGRSYRARLSVVLPPLADRVPGTPPATQSRSCRRRCRPAISRWPLRRSRPRALTLLKLVGSAAVIAVIEEFFFRGFSIAGLDRAPFGRCRWVCSTCRPFGRWPWSLRWNMTAWRPGCWRAWSTAGWRCTGDIWAAALAHGVTNLALGVYDRLASIWILVNREE